MRDARERRPARAGRRSRRGGQSEPGAGGLSGGGQVGTCRARAVERVLREPPWISGREGAVARARSGRVPVRGGRTRPRGQVAEGRRARAARDAPTRTPDPPPPLSRSASARRRAATLFTRKRRSARSSRELAITTLRFRRDGPTGLGGPLGPFGRRSGQARAAVIVRPPFRHRSVPGEGIAAGLIGGGGSSADTSTSSCRTRSRRASRRSALSGERAASHCGVLWVGWVWWGSYALNARRDRRVIRAIRSDSSIDSPLDESGWPVDADRGTAPGGGSRDRARRRRAGSYHT